MRAIVSLLLSMLAGSLTAHAASSDRPEATMHPPGLEAYVLGGATALQREYQEAGLAVAVTGVDGPWVLQGFGLANAETGQSADADTLFRIGSITKTFTWTAVMMLVDRGLLDLDRDVNDYLRELRIPEGFDAPVTMRHLMSLTSGFEDVPLFAMIDPDGAQSHADALAASMPSRVFAPGQRRAYSNWGSELAALIVADVSGMSFDEFLQREILDPLGLRSTTMADPGVMDEAHASRLAMGHRRSDGRFETRPIFRFGAIGAAGEIAASAADMARWMRFHLNRGELDGVRLMSRATHERMWPSALDPSITASTWSHGFMMRPVNGVLQVGHGGGVGRFLSLMWLAPEQGFGVFAVSNGGARIGAGPALADRLFAHLSPPSTAAARTFPDVELSPYAGDYLTNWRAFERFYRVLANRITVQVRTDGNEALLVSTGESTQRYLPIAAAPEVFENANGERIHFLRENDRVVAVHLPLGRTSHERVSGVDHPRTLSLVGAAAVLLALTTLLGFWRRWKQAPESTVAGRQRWAGSPR